MTQKSNKGKYRQLFKKLKQKDEELAPSFERVWQAALAKTERTDRTWNFQRFAIAAALMIALVGSLLFYKLQSPAPVQTMGEWRAPTNSLLNFSPDGLLIAEVSITKPKIAVSLSEWESPTTYLLEVPRFDIRKSIFEN